ncbi:MAG: hypothetical protein WCW93_01755 [Candidatus Paceibacterota bacterium]
MKDKKFTLFHLFWGIVGLLIAQAFLFWFWPNASINTGLILIFGIVGVGMNIYVAIEAIEEVSSRLEMLIFLSLIVLEFILFFSFEYWFLILEQPASFPTLTADFLNLVLHSTMVFIFNPIHLPATAVGSALILINTLGTLGLVLFILQNVWQLRPANPDSL